MDDITRAFQRAAFRLEEAAAELDSAVGEANTAQSKHDALTRRMVDLVKSRDQSWDATARAALKSLSGKHSLQQRKLDRQKELLENALATYRTSREAFDTFSDQYSDRLVELKAASRDRQRREGAMIRAFLVNKFRGDLKLFDEGVTEIEIRAKWPCLGVIPWLPAASKLPAEDALVLDTPLTPSGKALKIAAPILLSPSKRCDCPRRRKYSRRSRRLHMSPR